MFENIYEGNCVLVVTKPGEPSESWPHNSYRVEIVNGQTIVVTLLGSERGR